MESKLDSAFCLTRFPDANRYPLRLKTLQEPLACPSDLPDRFGASGLAMTSIQHRSGQFRHTLSGIRLLAQRPFLFFSFVLP
jgi:hypothetical protein